jgi:hypothetical protein
VDEASGLLLPETLAPAGADEGRWKFNNIAMTPTPAIVKWHRKLAYGAQWIVPHAIDLD